ncbi:MAG TPA: hypothetical protein VJS64_11915, partial [Pyrinomonadaceae bacterium]|nr:hypothetical protein [Pyrinomonadaceae bacterium]
SQVIDISESAKDELISSRCFKLGPRLATNQTLCQFPVMYEPSPLKEVKIFRPGRTGVENFVWGVK